MQYIILYWLYCLIWYFPATFKLFQTKWFSIIQMLTLFVFCILVNLNSWTELSTLTKSMSFTCTWIKRTRIKKKHNHGNIILAFWSTILTNKYCLGNSMSVKMSYKWAITNNQIINTKETNLWYTLNCIHSKFRLKFVKRLKAT